MRNFPFLGFIIFLVSYGYIKYTAMPHLMGQPQYIMTTSLLVLLTAIMPFFVTYFASRNLTSSLRYAVAGLLPLVLATVGLALYFYMLIAPNAPGMSVMQVLPRAVVPGLVMGALLILPLVIRREG